MICLDTNFLIRALIPGTKEALAIEQWLSSRELLSIPAVAWYEFLCGSTEEEERLALYEVGREGRRMVGRETAR
jgi:predicted nucleic acid-binding protein